MPESRLKRVKTIKSEAQMRASELKVERRGLNKGVLSIRTELEKVDKTEQLQIVNVRRRQERSAQTRQRILEGGL